MQALRANFTIEQGTTFGRIVRLKDVDTKEPIDITGYTALMQIRKARGDSTVLAQLSTDSLPEDNGTIVVDGPAGTLTLEIEHTETALFIFEYGVYDLLVFTPGGKRLRVIEGSVTFSPRATEE